MQGSCTHAISKDENHLTVKHFSTCENKATSFSKSAHDPAQPSFLARSHCGKISHDTSNVASPQCTSTLGEAF